MRYNLTNVSRGKGQQRQLFIGRKFTPMDLFDRLIEAGGSTPKYELEDRTSASQVVRWPSKGPLLFR
ncbi:hypothetical protein AVEN_87901-1 [Araneus ventricosus]|uniref:Uncharacterized protein n=1 Tax=Araneus ventricosus TaxID=182803 RepID=A0A4Y2BEM4_ARAVE|nr:hypothetical protein AVEN_87901-1 [Araneus ventricosus]